jgi:hypothetical protein
VTSKVRRVLQRYNAEFKGREECGVCGEETLLVFEDYTGTYTTCANPKCTAHGDLNYYPKAGDNSAYFSIGEKYGKAV